MPEKLTGHVVLYGVAHTGGGGYPHTEELVSGELLAIGALRLDADRGFEVLDEFRILARPLRHPGLSDCVIQTTGLTQARIDAEAVHPANALRRFGAFCGGCQAWSYGRDDLVLARNRSWLPLAPSPHSGGYGDIRPVLEDAGIAMEDHTPSSLRLAAGCVLDVHPHDILYVPQSIAACLKALRCDGRL